MFNRDPKFGVMTSQICQKKIIFRIFFGKICHLYEPCGQKIMWCAVILCSKGSTNESINSPACVSYLTALKRALRALAPPARAAPQKCARMPHLRLGGWGIRVHLHLLIYLKNRPSQEKLELFILYLQISSTQPPKRFFLEI